MDKIEREAHAKINLTLAVTGKREDGYHTLSTVMQEISLCDTLVLEKADGVSLAVTGSDLAAGEDNLCVKAAKLFFRETGIRGGVAMKLDKRIPTGAGLGGGSSDAAAVLSGLSQLYEAEADLYAMAVGLGADVPFFLAGGTCLCTGIGEILTPLYFPGKAGLWCVIAKGKAGLSTPSVYAAYDALPPKGRSASPQGIAEAMTWGAPEAIFPFLVNELEEAAFRLLPEIREWRSYLKVLGAEAALMTGSGSAVFGLFREREAAAWAAANVKDRGAETFLCRLI